jgi:tetratricopeptide (TPR) repeat protein
LQRYLRGLPVAAQKDSLLYRAHRFAARNRIGVATAAAFLALLIAAIIVTTLQSRRVASAQRRAEAERATAEEVVRVLVDLFERSNPAVYPGGDTTRVATLIEVGEEKVESLSGDPALQARLWHVLANIHIARSRYDRAEALFERALENERNATDDRRSDTLETLHGIARIRAITESPQATLPLMREIVAGMTKFYEPNDERLVTAKQDLAVATTDPREKERLFDEVLAALRAATPRDDIAISSALNQVGMYYYRRDGLRARPLFEEAIRLIEPILPADHPNRLGIEKNLGSVLSHLGEWEEAEKRARYVLEQSRRVLGERSKRVGGALELLGESLANQGRHAEAEAAYREVVDIFAAVIGPDNWRVGADMMGLARTIAQQGRYGEAEALARRAIAVLDRSESAHSVSASARAQLALMIAAGGGARLADAAAEARAARDVITALGDGAERDAVAQVNLAAALIAIETNSLRVSPESTSATSASGATRGLSLAEAESLLREALAIRRELFVGGHPAVAEAQCALAAALAAQGRRDEASQLLRDAFPRYRAWGFAQSFVVRRLDPLAANLAG